ncbi:MAG: 50S ribosomal protein L29 [Bacteroidia bacterium]
MKYSEIKELSTAEIADRIKEEKLQLTKLKFSHAVAAIDSPAKIRESRKVIARLMTELNQRRGEASVANNN